MNDRASAHWPAGCKFYEARAIEIRSAGGSDEHRETDVLCFRQTWLTAVIGTFALSPAVAHNWYPITCCTDKDCRELAENKGEVVTETAAGWRLWDGRLIPKDVVKTSPDGKFHLCESRKVILCFFVPPGSS